MKPEQAESPTMTVTCSPQEAAALVRPRDTIGFGLGPGNPDAFLTALGERDDWEDLVLGGALPVSYTHLDVYKRQPDRPSAPSSLRRR